MEEAEREISRPLEKLSEVSAPNTCAIGRMSEAADHCPHRAHDAYSVVPVCATTPWMVPTSVTVQYCTTQRRVSFLALRALRPIEKPSALSTVNSYALRLPDRSVCPFPRSLLHRRPYEIDVELPRASI